MNTLENLKKGTAKNGVSTPDGTLYAVKNGEALEIWLQQNNKDFVKVVTVEHLTSPNSLSAIVYNEVYNQDAEPQIVLLDTDSQSEEKEVVFSYVVHTLEVKNGKVIDEYFEHFNDKELAHSQFVSNVICEKRAFEYDQVRDVKYVMYDESFLAYIDGKKKTDYKLIEIEEIPELVRVIKY